MIERKTVIDRIEIVRSGQVQVRLGLLLVEDGQEIGSSWHRTTIEPGGSVDDAMMTVNAGIASLGSPPVDDSNLPLLKSICDLVHTPDVVKAYQATVAQSLASAEP